MFRITKDILLSSYTRNSCWRNLCQFLTSNFDARYCTNLCETV